MVASLLHVGLSSLPHPSSHTRAARAVGACRGRSREDADAAELPAAAVVEREDLRQRDRGVSHRGVSCPANIGERLTVEPNRIARGTPSSRSASVLTGRLGAGQPRATQAMRFVWLRGQCWRSGGGRTASEYAKVTPARRARSNGRGRGTFSARAGRRCTQVRARRRRTARSPGNLPATSATTSATAGANSNAR